MVLICPRIQFLEINDQPWWPDYLREKVQSALTLAWTFRVPYLQTSSPAQLVASTLCRILSSSVTEYTYVDFCAGAGGPTPFIEQNLNALLLSDQSRASRGDTDNGAVEFLLTDLHPHIAEWAKVASRSEHLGFVSEPVDAASAPTDLVQRDGKRTFRLFFLAFHHFDNAQARKILRNTLETADGFGIFELQHRTVSSLITITGLGVLMLLISPFYFRKSPGHLFFTYIIPLVPLVLVFDGYVSSLRTRTSDEIRALMRSCGTSSNEWTVRSGAAQHTWPTGYMHYVIGVRGKGLDRN